MSISAPSCLSRYQFLGSLRENICYPHLDSLKNLTDERLEFLLAQVGLSHLLHQQNEDGDERFINWSTRLGLGEQQRLAIVRVQCPKHFCECSRL